MPPSRVFIETLEAHPQDVSLKQWAEGSLNQKGNKSSFDTSEAFACDKTPRHSGMNS